MKYLIQKKTEKGDKVHGTKRKPRVRRRFKPTVQYNHSKVTRGWVGGWGVVVV